LLVSTFGRSGFDPILLVIVAAVAGGRLPARGVALVIAAQSVLLAVIIWIEIGLAAVPVTGAYAGFMVFAAITATIAENERRARAVLCAPSPTRKPAAGRSTPRFPARSIRATMPTAFSY
jgi:hypothetical protein